MKNRNIFHAFSNAFKGITHFFATEKNGQIQLLITIAVLIISFLFKISVVEWMLVILLCGLVMATEIINTIIEKICDRITTDYDEKIKVIKDMSAGAVLFIAIIAAVIGFIIFVPYFKTIIL